MKTRLTPAETATVLNVSADQVRKWCESGELPSYRSVHGWRKIDRAELIAFAQKLPRVSRKPSSHGPAL
jgi:excisionase family DNA binding protein